ncbi:VanZ family protein [Microbacterium sp. Marseille-Q6648]|uniref:VanZ family protein n=1 Tax=Microbacterium sp. Marseille-Q6648 TaxID=2937991 RepID=UPI00203D39BB|nr:VanZ family protein [Microbacterium sp. Marseille-Q6648]
MPQPADDEALDAALRELGIPPRPVGPIPPKPPLPATAAAASGVSAGESPVTRAHASRSAPEDPAPGVPRAHAARPDPASPAAGVPRAHAARPDPANRPHSDPATRPTPESHAESRWARTALGIYIAVLTLIAIWPVPVDSGAGPLIRAITRVLPVVTHARLEFGANILLFVPLGALLAVILARRYLVVPIAFVTTVGIESVQALALDRRVPSVMDIIANVTGACLGLLLVGLVEWWRSRPQRP